MPPAFHDSVSVFQKFLKDQNWPDRILWIRPADILVAPGKRFYIKLPVPEQNVHLAQEDYDAAVARKLGIKLETLCELPDRSSCYVWSPRDQQEARQMMMPSDGTLKLSVRTGESKILAKPVRSPVLWWLLGKRHPRDPRLIACLFG